LATEDQSLSQFVRVRGGLDGASAAPLLEQVFAAKNAAPCDLNPENIHVASDGQSLHVKPLARGNDEDDEDAWTLGSLTFFLLTGAPYGRVPGDSAERPQGLMPATQRAAELGVETALPAGFDAWFARAAPRDPERRFRDPAEAWQALSHLLGATSRVPTAGRPSVVVRPGLFITLVISSVVGAGLVIYWLLRSMHI
jgi:hypothetical protein